MMLGRGGVFRIDRLDTGNGFENNPVDITAIFKAIVDFDNVEVGWMDFPVGSAPSFCAGADGARRCPIGPRSSTRTAFGSC